MENETQNKPLTPSELFRLWADKIDKNAPEDFAGAFLVIPPKGDAVSGLFIDSEQDVNTFYALVKTKIDTAVETINQRQRGMY